MSQALGKRSWEDGLQAKWSCGAGDASRARWSPRLSSAHDIAKPVIHLM